MRIHTCRYTQGGVKTFLVPAHICRRWAGAGRNAGTTWVPKGSVSLVPASYQHPQQPISYSTNCPGCLLTLEDGYQEVQGRFRKYLKTGFSGVEIWKVLESSTGSGVPIGREDSWTILEVLENLKLSEWGFAGFPKVLEGSKPFWRLVWRVPDWGIHAKNVDQRDATSLLRIPLEFSRRLAGDTLRTSHKWEAKDTSYFRTKNHRFYIDIINSLFDPNGTHYVTRPHSKR